MSDSSLFSQYIYISKYSRYLPKEGRRETWEETISRYFDFFTEHLKEKHGFDLENNELRSILESNVLSQKVMPSMRCLMTAGPALERENVAGYNCAYTAIDHPKVFAEILYILMCGTGAGFSVERQYVNKLPMVPDELYPTDSTIVVNDSKLGWAKALNELVGMLYTGVIPHWDLSKVRPAGAPLKTFGGRSSGPAPLERLFKFIIEQFKNAKGERLTSIQCHDIVCMIGECVVVGGVRRSATISLSNLSDDRMRNAKSGQWWTLTPWRSIANNSAVYNDKQPTMETFFNEWKSLYDSKSGERGIFSRYAARHVIEHSNKLRQEWFGPKVRRRDPDFEAGCNPCSEIILHNGQFCNLTEIVVREDDTLETLIDKAKVAAVLGTFQSTLTSFKFLGKKWKENTEDERLLGVSLTGIMDNKLMSGQLGEDVLKEVLLTLRKTVIATNIHYAKLLGIEPSVATTCCKPSGTVSALVNSASGIHPRHSRFYLRSVRSDNKDPLSNLMIDQGFYYEPDQMRPDHQNVFYFPIKAPENALWRQDVSAIQHLKLWLTYQKYWTEHKPSITVSVREEEWLEVGAFVYKNFEWMSGISFLPYADHTYQQAPFQEISEDTYKEWLKKTPKDIDWTLLRNFEKEDLTTGAQTMACVAGGCEL